jgi:hypothetical protein
MGRIELSLEKRFLALCRQLELNCRTRQDIVYAAERAAMALDLWHLEAAEREIRAHGAGRFRGAAREPLRLIRGISRSSEVERSLHAAGVITAQEPRWKAPASADRVGPLPALNQRQRFRVDTVLIVDRTLVHQRLRADKAWRSRWGSCLVW